MNGSFISCSFSGSKNGYKIRKINHQKGRYYSGFFDIFRKKGKKRLGDEEDGIEYPHTFKEKKLVKKYASTLMDNPSYVDKCVSALLQCASIGNDNDLLILQNIVVAFGKETLGKAKNATLWLSTNDLSFAGNHKLMKLLSDIAKERLKAPPICSCSNGNICLHSKRQCPFPTTEYYPLCVFMKEHFFTEWNGILWEWNLEYGKKKKP